MAYGSTFFPSSSPEEDFSPSSYFEDSLPDDSQGGFGREGYGQSGYGYGYEQMQRSGPKPETVIKLSIQPSTQKWFASLRGGSHVYHGNSLDELARVMASIGGRGFLEMDTVGFDYQGKAVPMSSESCHEYRINHFGVLPELKIVPGLSRIKCGGGRKRAIRGTELANSYHAEQLAEMITEYRIQALQEHAAKAERTRIATEQNNKLAAERNSKIQRNMPQTDESRQPVSSHGYTTWRGDSWPHTGFTW